MLDLDFNNFDDNGIGKGSSNHYATSELNTWPLSNYMYTDFL